MKFYIILLTTLLFSHYSYATSSSETTELVTLANHEYKSGNYDNAISLYKKAESFDSPVAMLKLSSIYKRGKVTLKNENLANKYLDKAINIYEKLANNNDIDAQFNLGRIYKYRVKPPKNIESYQWYLKAANEGHMLAQYAVATALDRGSAEPEVKRNFTEALTWYEKSAEQGNSGAAVKMAHNARRDFNSVTKWCLPVAIQEDDRWSAKCLEILNTSIVRALLSKEHRKKAIDVMHKLANSNIVMSQVALAAMYEKGDILTKDMHKSKKWSGIAFNTALSKAQQGDKQAQYELAFLYQKGIGTDVYIDQARQWLTKSSEQGYRPAIKALVRLNDS